MASQLLSLSTPPEDRCMSNTDYLAGLWRDDFIYGLGWARPHSSPTETRPQHYCGPSWSWASVHGFVGYESWRGNRGQLARFVDAGVDLFSQQHPFGMVTSGWALLRVRLLRLVENEQSRVGPSGIAFLSAYECGVHFPSTVVWDSESYFITRSQSGEPINMEESGPRPCIGLREPLLQTTLPILIPTTIFLADQASKASADCSLWYSRLYQSWLRRRANDCRR